MKKWLALVLAVCMLVISVPAMASGVERSGSSWIGEGQYLSQTSLYGSSSNKLHNIALAIEALNGTVVYEGEEFSFNTVVGPRTRERGYLAARNGRGVDDIQGAGVSQVATTLYLALRDAADVTIHPFDAYEEDFKDWYVEDGYDAVITDYAVNKDFKFTSKYEGAIYINVWMDDSYVYCLLSFDENGQKANQVARASTPIFGSANKEHNILLAADSLNGVVLQRGDVFSFNALVGPRTKEEGFRSAENGRGVKVCGGGVAQVASTIYLAVKELDNVAIDPVKTYGKKFTDGYVADAADAIITDYNAGTDFSFTYWGNDSLLVLVYQDGDRLVCEMYEFSIFR